MREEKEREREPGDMRRTRAGMLTEILELRKKMLALQKPEMELYDAAVDDFDPRMQVMVWPQPTARSRARASEIEGCSGNACPSCAAL